MQPRAALPWLLGAAACASGTTPAQPVDARFDGPGADADAPPGDGPPEVVAVPLLTEVVLTPNAGEMIELFNPSSDRIDLSTYYLTDTGNYFRLPAGGVAVDASDFVVRFPAGASIPARSAITVAIDTAASFQAHYGVAPTFSIASGTMVGVAVGTMPTLTNGGELVALFHWDGQGDLVEDVDLVLAGVPSAANGIVDKSGVMIDGPDADTTPTAYKADARTIPPQASAPGVGLSTKRIRLEAGHELQLGTGNGVTGDDETSEDTSATWDTTATFSEPTPGAVPQSLL